MQTLKGTGIYPGVVFGKIFFYGRPDVKRTHVADVKAEVARLDKARSRACADLKVLYDKTVKEIGESEAGVFEAHLFMLEDDDFYKSSVNYIERQGINAEYAAAMTGEEFAKTFAAMDDEYMRARAADVHDVTERLITVLQGGGAALPENGPPVILAADDLMPSETAQLKKDRILAFVTAGGSASSHTAVIARASALPAVVGVGESLNSKLHGADAIVDGATGAIYVNPDAATVSKMRKAEEAQKNREKLLKTLKGKENITLDGIKIHVTANIGGIRDAESALRNDADGVGLFRTEFLYLNESDYPDETKQFNEYKAVVEAMGGRAVIIRTMDLGADKKPDYMDIPPEANPDLGYRAIRFCLDHRDIFKTQLRALYRASSFGQVAIMFPMIASLWEIKEIKKITEEVKRDLKAEKREVGKVPLGIMIETPAAALISEELAAEVDFFSVGTNDLTQYTLAADRRNERVKNFADPHHKAVLRLIKLAADNIHKHNGKIGICGELAADLSMTETFLSIGIDKLSVSPPMVLPLREKIRSINVSKVKKKILAELTGV